MGRKLIKVPLGRDNVVTLAFTNDGVAVDLSAVTRYLLILSAGVTIDSQVELTVFDATGGGGMLDLKFGNLVAPPAAGDYAAAQIVTYDASNPQGIVWDDELHLRFSP